jgi:hypothetical protein
MKWMPMSMEKHDDLVNRLTHRLRIDPELRMDVAHELRAHLEDSTTEFRRGGYSEKEATENAVKALGDQTELAQNLWLANKRRVRIRQVVKWAGRVTLVPAAIIVTLLVAYQGTSQLALSGFIDSDTYVKKVKSLGVTEEQQFILRGDPQARTNLERQKSIADRWPENPVYYANYIAAYLGEKTNKERIFDRKDPQAIQEAISLLNRGQKLEPQNAFYNVYKAGILFNLAGKITDQSKYTYVMEDRIGYAVHKNCNKITITDQKSLEEGLAELRAGAAKPYFNTHVADMMNTRLSILPAPRNFPEYLNRTVFLTGSISHPLIEPRIVGKAACAYALELAEEGKEKEAIATINQVKILGLKIATQTRVLIELLIAQGIYESALGHAINVYKILGLPQDENRATEELSRQNQFNQTIRKMDPNLQNEIKLYGGFLQNVLAPALPGYRPDLEPLRKTEYAVAERVALLDLLFSIDLLAILLGLVTLALCWKWRNRDDGPKLLFVGWRAMAMICFWAILVPIGVYALYNYGMPLGLHDYGLNITLPRVIMEFVVTINVMIVLLLCLSYVSIRRRAQEAGMVVPPVIRLGQRKWFIIAGLIGGLDALVILILWSTNAGGVNAWFSGSPLSAFCLVVPLILIMAAWVIFELVRLFRLPEIYGHFRRTLLRSLVPIFTLTAVVVGTLCGLMVARAETSAIKNASCSIDSEIRQSNFQLLKDRLTQQHEKLLTEYLRQAGKK